MKIFITGATGFIGTCLIKRLTQTDHELVCLARETSATHALKAAGAEIILGDVTDTHSLLKGMEGCDWVAHLASSFVFWTANKQVFRDVNVTGTRNVMESALEKGVSKVVYISSAAVYGNAGGPVTEESPFGNERASQYVKTKFEGDLIAWDLYQKKNLPLVVLYPSAVIGADDPKATGRYIKNVFKGRMPAQVLTNCYFPFVSVKDVAESILKSLEKENNIGEKYIISAENHTFGEINHFINELSGARLPLLKLPIWMTTLTSYMLTGIANLIGKPPIWDMSVDQISLMKQGLKVDGSKAERELGITYIPIKTAIGEAIVSYRNKQ
jgi:dihydroflavonol-4-reductase